MPLKRSYTAEADVPTEQKAFYSQKGDRWELQIEGVDSLDGLLTKRSELLTKVATHDTQLAAKDTRIAELEGQLSNASTVPRGQEAVPKSDAELARAVKAAGVETAEAFKTLHTEHGTFKTQAESATKREKLETLRKRLNWNDASVEVLSLISDLPEWEDRDVTANGKTEKVPHAKIVTKNSSGADEVSWKPYAEYFKEKHAALLPSVTSKLGLIVGTQGAPEGPQGELTLEQMVEENKKSLRASNRYGM